MIQYRRVYLEEFALFFKNKFPDMQTESPFEAAKGCTVGCGGRYSVAVFPRSFTELIEVVDFCIAEGKRYFVLGNGSNVLPSDGENEAVLIFTKKLVGGSFGQNPLVYAGVQISTFLNDCEKHGKSGAEFLAGIPSTVGGAAFMNAGAHGKRFDEIVKNVIVYKDGELHSYPKEECGYSYKHSRFMDEGGVIFAVIFNLEETDSATVRRRRKEHIEARAWLPKGKSMGCVFKNPDGVSAGQLIEGAGLKGLRIGGAVVSDVHANFILNDGGATSKDIKTLIGIIKNSVYAQYKIRLEEEIRYL